MKWTRRSLLGLNDLSREEIEFILDLAEEFKLNLTDKKKPVKTLSGMRVVNLFLEPSTRTRVAFEIAAKSLNADVISIASQSSSLTKGESLKDTALNIQALGADAIVIRHSSAGSPLFLSNVIPVPIINAGDGAHEHPSQALLDIFTLRQKLGNLEGKKIVILGDILFSRVARSNLWGLKKMGARVTLAGPATLGPKLFQQLGADVSYDIEKSLLGADAVM